jgi:hypothetical protein
MHCELLIPDLFAAEAGGAAPRLASLELLLARGRRSENESENDAARGLEAWLAREFGCDAPLPAGALSVLADGVITGGDQSDALWLRADPIHLAIEREHATIVPSAAFAVTREEAEALCETLNRHFAAELTIYPLHPERWCARLHADIAPPLARSPLELARLPLKEHLPAGEDAKRWHGLLNEAQMLLHGHPVNAAREARGALPINSLWFWGAGRLPRSAAPRGRSRFNSVTADEPLARGLARRAGIAPRELPRDAAAWLAASPADGVHLVVLDGLRAPLALGDAQACAASLREIDARWCAPLLDALRAGRVGMVTIHAPEAGLSFEATRGDLRRFWRRARSLERYAVRAGGHTDD